MTERQEYFKQYYQNNKDKYKKTQIKKKEPLKFKIEVKKVIIRFD